MDRSYSSTLCSVLSPYICKISFLAEDYLKIVMTLLVTLCSQLSMQDVITLLTDQISEQTEGLYL